VSEFLVIVEIMTKNCRRYFFGHPMLLSAWCREDWIRAIQSVAERLQVLDDFDGQFSDDVSKLSKLKKKVVSSGAVVAAAVASCD